MRAELKVDILAARILCSRKSGSVGFARKADGTGVKVEFWDLGDKLPALDRAGLYSEAYTSVFRVEGIRFYSVTPRCDRVGLLERMSHDAAALAAAGVDLSSFRFL